MPSASATDSNPDKIDWVGSIPFIAMHFVPLGAVFTGVRVSDVVLCVVLYYARMFFITAGYHRYFAHRGYKLGRVMQFLMAVGGASAVQKGPLWWAGYHRLHHKYSDTEQDVHSPKKGFFWSQMGWIMAYRYQETRLDVIKDFAKYPEILWINRYHLVPGIALGLACFFVGGPSALFIGFFLSTVLLWHGTFTINSLAHVIGRRRFATSDTSKNSFILALITMGEGWHNNHHYFCTTANQGFYWWEVDMSYYVLRVLSWVGLAKDLRTPPPHVLAKGREKPGSDASEGAPESNPTGSLARLSEPIIAMSSSIPPPVPEAP